MALKQRDSRNKRLPSLGSSFAQRKRSLISTPSTKTGVVTMEAMPQQIPPYLLLYLCAIANQTAAVQTCFLRGGFAGGCSRPHVLPFHSPSVGLTLPFNEGPHFPCFRSREMESPRRRCDGMGAWGGSAVANPLSPRLAPSRPGAVLVKLTPGPTAAPTQIPVCTSKQEGVWWEIADYHVLCICRRAGSNTRAKFPEVLRLAPLSPK